MSESPAWLALIEAALNRNLSDSFHAQELARGLEGKVLELEAVGMTRVAARIAHGRIVLWRPRGLMQPAADAAISASLPNLLKTLPRNAHVRGDAEVASRFRDLLRALRPDLEHELARFTGDLPAHGIARAARACMHWSLSALRAARENTAEYLVEEARLLVNRTEHDEFLRGVDRLRELSDRVDARLTRLEERHSSRLDSDRGRDSDAPSDSSEAL